MHYVYSFVYNAAPIQNYVRTPHDPVCDSFTRASVPGMAEISDI